MKTIGKYIERELEFRGLLVSDISTRCGSTMRKTVRDMAYGEYPDKLKNALCIELGFSSWDELTQAALSAVDA